MTKTKILIILFITSLILNGCGKVKHQALISIKIPYHLSIDELLTNLGKYGDSFRERGKLHNNYWKELGRDMEDIGYAKVYDDVLKTKIVAIPVIVKGLTVISRNTLYIRECSFKGDYLHDTGKSYPIFMINIPPQGEYKGTLLINPEHLRKLHWIDDTNKLQKDICLNTMYEMDSDLEQYTQGHKINPEALKRALDAQEGEK